MRLPIKIAVVLAIQLFLGGCREDKKIVEYRQLRALPPAQLEEHVIALPPDEQVKLYLLAASYFKPPDIRLAPTLAKQGVKVLPAIVAELDNRTFDVSPIYLVSVLHMMALTYSVKEAQSYAPRVKEWCTPYFSGDSPCHEMGRQMAAANLK